MDVIFDLVLYLWLEVDLGLFFGRKYLRFSVEELEEVDIDV